MLKLNNSINNYVLQLQGVGSHRYHIGRATGCHGDGGRYPAGGKVHVQSRVSYCNNSLRYHLAYDV